MLNGHETRMKFALRQIERGYDVKRWYNELGLQTKEYWLEHIGE